jgi:hypothetical protein
VSGVSPAVQLRQLLEQSRQYGRSFDVAWEMAIQPGRIRWPHDTVHRREWKLCLGVEDEYGNPIKSSPIKEVWRAAYYRVPVETSREKSLSRLVIAA